MARRLRWLLIMRASCSMLIRVGCGCFCRAGLATPPTHTLYHTAPTHTQWDRKWNWPHPPTKSSIHPQPDPVHRHPHHLHTDHHGLSAGMMTARVAACALDSVLDEHHCALLLLDMILLLVLLLALLQLLPLDVRQAGRQAGRSHGKTSRLGSPHLSRRFWSKVLTAIVMTSQ